MGEYTGFPSEVDEKGRTIIEVIPDRLVAIVDGDSVILNALRFPFKDGFDYDSIKMSLEQLDVLVRQIKGGN